MRLLYFGLILLLIHSCGGDDVKEAKNKKNVEIKAEIPMPLYSDDMVFADEFVIAKKFSNGDAILHAQSKADWADAAKNGIPAWCYVDSINMQGVLYNGFCLSNSRTLFEDENYLNEIDAAVFCSVFDAPEVDEVDLYMTERNYQGNFYNLGFQNIWIKDTNKDSGMKYALSYHPSRAQVQLRKAHPGNGYFIRKLKK